MTREKKVKMINGLENIYFPRVMTKDEIIKIHDDLVFCKIQITK
jgi:hypothetical protein